MRGEISVLPAAFVAVSQSPLCHGWLSPPGPQLPAALLPAAFWMTQPEIADSSPLLAGSPTLSAEVGRRMWENFE